MAKKLHSLIHSRDAAMAAMEPALRDVIKRARAEANCLEGAAFEWNKFNFGSDGMRADVHGDTGRVFLALHNDDKDFFVGRFDEDAPAFPNHPLYCGGKVSVACWKRGAWEAEFGAGLIVEPFLQDVIPQPLIKLLRKTLNSRGSRRQTAQKAAEELREWVDSAVRGDIDSSLAQDEAAEGYAVAATIQIPGPRFAMAYVLALGLNFVGGEIVRAAWDTALTKCPNGVGEGVAIIEELLGSNDAASRFLVFYEIGGKSYEGDAWATL